jgi:hypothetical protein
VTDRLDEALFALVRRPARSDLRARILARLASTPTPERPHWVPAAVMATAVAIAMFAPLAWRSFHRAPTSAIVAVASPPAGRAAAPAVGGGSATPVFAASPAAPVVRAHRVPAQRPMEAQVTAFETDLAIAPLAAPAAIRIEPIEAERSAITSLASDPLVIPPLDAETVPGQEERP